MSVESTEFILGEEEVKAIDEITADELRFENIVNWEKFGLRTGAVVFRFTGPLDPQTVAIMNRNGFRLRSP